MTVPGVLVLSNFFLDSSSRQSIPAEVFRTYPFPHSFPDIPSPVQTFRRSLSRPALPSDSPTRYLRHQEINCTQEFGTVTTTEH
jgi:hypothetical protein